jgi:hypothetical protein
MPIGHIEKGIRKILYHKMIITAHYQKKGERKHSGEINMKMEKIYIT